MLSRTAVAVVRVWPSRAHRSDTSPEAAWHSGFNLADALVVFGCGIYSLRLDGTGVFSTSAGEQEAFVCLVLLLSNNSLKYFPELPRRGHAQRHPRNGSCGASCGCGGGDRNGSQQQCSNCEVSLCGLLLLLSADVPVGVWTDRNDLRMFAGVYAVAVIVLLQSKMRLHVFAAAVVSAHWRQHRRSSLVPEQTVAGQCASCR